MAALRALRVGDYAIRETPPLDLPADWLTIQQAACELDVSASTVRRMMRDGRLRYRVANRRHRRIYLIHMPDSRHAVPAPARVIDLTERKRERDEGRLRRSAAGRDDIVRRLEQQVEHLSEALARARRLHRRSLPVGVGQPDGNPDDPYERYRWLARRRRWWPFS